MVADMRMLKCLFMLLCLMVPGRVAAFDEGLPAFPYQDGWMGGDDAYSIPLDTNGIRSVWLFGDSFVRDDALVKRDGAGMVANTVGVRTSDGAGGKINYYWRHDGNGTVDAFFSTGTKAWRYWAEDGWVNGGKLYVCLIRVQSLGNGALDFREIGVDLAAIKNPQDSPVNWQIRYTALSSSAKIFPGISTVVDGGYVYLFADQDDAAHKENRPIYLERISLAMFDSEPIRGLEYLAKGNVWKTGSVGDDALVIMDRGVTEMTVRWHPGIRRWVEIQISNEFPGHHIWRREAANLAGPWSKPVSIYTIPEYLPSSHRYKPDAFFYAAKEHVEFLNPANGNGAVTYVGNSMSLSNVTHDLELYAPESVRLDIDSPRGDQ